MDCKLTEDGGNDVPIPDIVLRALFGESFDGLAGYVSITCICEKIALGLPWRGRYSESRRS